MEIQGCARCPPLLLTEGHLQGSLLSCHGYTDLPGLRELEETVVHPHVPSGSEQRAGLGAVCGDPATFQGPPAHPPHCSPSPCLVPVFSPFGSLFLCLKIFPPFFFPLFLSSLCLSSPWCVFVVWCVVCVVRCGVVGRCVWGVCVQHKPLSQTEPGSGPSCAPSLSHMTVGSHFLGLGLLICKMGLMGASHEAMQVLRTCPVSPLTCSLSSLFSPFISSPSFLPLSPQ